MSTSTAERTLFDWVPVEEITADARRATPGRTALVIIGAVFIAIGWTVAKIFGVVWLSASWCVSAMKYGWRAGRGTLNRPTYDQLWADNQRLRAENERVS